MSVKLSPDQTNLLIQVTNVPFRKMLIKQSPPLSLSQNHEAHMMRKEMTSFGIMKKWKRNPVVLKHGLTPIRGVQRLRKFKKYLDLIKLSDSQLAGCPWRNIFVS